MEPGEDCIQKSRVAALSIFTPGADLKPFRLHEGVGWGAAQSVFPPLDPFLQGKSTSGPFTTPPPQCYALSNHWSRGSAGSSGLATISTTLLLAPGAVSAATQTCRASAGVALDPARGPGDKCMHAYTPQRRCPSRSPSLDRCPARRACPPCSRPGSRPWRAPRS